jgi:hypothetical protein
VFIIMGGAVWPGGGGGGGGGEGPLAEIPQTPKRKKRLYSLCKTQKVALGEQS